MLQRLDLRRRSTAAGVHLLISATIAAGAALLVFGLWYPGAFRYLAGGRDLFLLVTSVDVVLGPVLTFAVFNRAKGWRHLRWDLTVIGLVQLAALAYGLHTVALVRPVAMVFEVDRFRLVTASDVPADDLLLARPPYDRLSWTGPSLLGARAPVAGPERIDSIFKAMGGTDVSSRPQFWQPYQQSKAAALARSRPVATLLGHYPAKADETRRRLADMSADESTARFLPAMARGEWVGVLNATGDVLGYLPLDGFF
jgi:hypothetical protein